MRGRPSRLDCDLSSPPYDEMPVGLLKRGRMVMFVNAAAIEGLRRRKVLLEAEVAESRSSVLAIPVELSRSSLDLSGAMSLGDDRPLRHPGAAYGLGRHLPVTGMEVIKTFIQESGRRAQGFVQEFGDQISSQARRDVAAMILTGEAIVAEITGETSKDRSRRGRPISNGRGGNSA